MIQRPCKCGELPTIAAAEMFNTPLLRIECKCGYRGPAVFCKKPSDEARTRQALEDGWNMGD